LGIIDGVERLPLNAFIMSTTLMLAPRAAEGPAVKRQKLAVVDRRNGESPAKKRRSHIFAPFRVCSFTNDYVPVADSFERL
jgi:hypothetical protein